MTNMMKKNNLWVKGEPKEIVKGVWAWERCLEIPDGIIDSMNKDVDDWGNDEQEEAYDRLQSLKMQR